MMTVVMSDGSAAAAKAIEVAGLPGGPLMPRHDSGQLIITHVWEKAPAAGAVFSVEAVDAVCSGSADPAVTGASGGMNKAPATVEAGVRAASQTASASLDAFSLLPNEGGATQGPASSGSPGTSGTPVAALSRQLPVVFVVQRVLQAIHHNKALKDGLNYLMETRVLPPLPRLQAAGAAVSEGDAESTTPRAKGKHPAAAARAADKGSSIPPPTSAAAAAGEQPAADAEADAALAEVERQLTHRATAIVQHALERVAYHKAGAIVLGAGSRQDGKTLEVGSVAKEALRAVSSTGAGAPLLYIVKADGFTPRHSTTAVRYVVVVPVSGQTDSASGSGSGSAWQAAPSAAREEAAVRAVRQAQVWCRAQSQDRVAVVLVTEPAAANPSASSSTEEHVRHYTQRLTALLADATPTHTSTSDPSKSQRTAQEVGTVIREEDTAVIDDMNSNRHNVASGEQEGGLPAAETGGWPTVSVCELKPGKHVPVATLDSPAVAQVAKFLQQRKLEVVVVSSLAPPPLQLTLLAMAKPHCLIVPTGGKA